MRWVSTGRRSSRTDSRRVGRCHRSSPVAARAAASTRRASDVEPTDRLAHFADRFAGGLSPAWRRAVLAAPRHLFAPSRAWCGPDDDRDGYPIDRGPRPEQWWDAVYDDAAIITQVDD